MRTNKKIFATNTDVGSVGAMVPVLSLLKAMGYEIVAFAKPNALAYDAFIQGGFTPLTHFDYSFNVCNLEAMSGVLRKVKPALVLCGVANDPEGSEKLAIKAASNLGLKTAVIIESWPLAWLNIRGDRDIPIYQKASVIFVPDSISKKIMVERGFSADCIIAAGNPVNDFLAEMAEKREHYRRETRQRLGIHHNATVVLFLITYDLDDVTYDSPSHPEWLGCSEADLVEEYLTAMHDGIDIAARFGRYLCGIIREKPGFGETKLYELIAKHRVYVPLDVSRKLQGVPTLLAADVVIGLNTLAVQNAGILGIPAIYYVPMLAESGKSDLQAISNQLGVTIPFHKKGMMSKLILQIASAPQKTLEALRSKVCNIELPFNATGSVASEIIKLVES